MDNSTGSQRTGVAEVAIWGHRPPPFGGMSVHIERLMPVLRQAGISVQGYSVAMRSGEHGDVRQVSERRLRWYAGLLLGRCEAVHYVLGGRSVTRFLASLLGVIRNRVVILRVGGESLESTGLKGGWVSRWMTRFAIRHAAAIIGVNPRICAVACQLGADPGRVHLIPGFIAPTDNGQPTPVEIRQFVAGGRPVLLCAGQVMPAGERDIYGLDVLLEFAPRFLHAYPAGRIVLVTYEVAHADPGLLEKYGARVRELGLTQRFLIYHSQAELWPLLKECDVFLRPTTTDGDANSVREALHFGVPVVASNCVNRVPGVVTFATGDAGALFDSVTGVVRDLERHRVLARQSAGPGNAARIVELIRSLTAAGGRGRRLAV